MLSLIAAILCSTGVSVVMRLSEKHRRSRMAMLTANYLTCIVPATLLAFSGGLPQTDGFPLAAGLGLVNGALYLAGLVLLERSVSANGVAMSSTFMKLGLLVPITVSAVFFRELPTLWQALGFVPALAAIVLIQSGPKGGTVTRKGLLPALLLAGGGSDAMSKVFEQLGNAAWSDAFLLITFLTALMLCLLLTIRDRQKPAPADFLWGILLGIPNFFSARFLLASLSELPAAVAYPLYSVGGILLISLLGLWLFREKLNRRQLIALTLVPVAAVLLNL